LKYWLMKSAPTTYSIEDLERDGSTYWDGVRNYRARNMMRDEMSVGDLVLYHHSSAKPPGVAGIAKVSKGGYPDFTAQDTKSPYFDPKATEKNPWIMVDVAFVEKFADVVSMDEMRETPGLEELPVLQRGQRLSILEVTKKQFEIVRKAGRAKG
jgi:predicted RNA-binding protein with PUA-like domain